MAWPSWEEWERLRKGIGCPMCADIHLEENPHGFLVVELKQSFVRLPRNQYLRGWTIVAFKRHVCELFDLSPQELSEFWQDVASVAQALNKLYSSPKINYAVYGNGCPHIHCHIIVQSYEAAPYLFTEINEQIVHLDPDEYQKIIADMRALLES